jgi:hypothetical protein
VVEKRDNLLVYRKSALDAFLAEYGTNPYMWTQGCWREVAEQLRRTGDPGFIDLIEMLERRDPPDEWDPRPGGKIEPARSPVANAGDDSQYFAVPIETLTQVSTIPRSHGAGCD